MVNVIKVSYVLTTYNKLPYLKGALASLISNRQQDEEIIVTDGGSTDGTVEFLQDLYQKGKIDTLVSQKDHGEAHGFNRGFLIAKGELIKLLSDDDVYDYSVIRKCKEFLLDNVQIDFLFANTTSINTQSPFSDLLFAKSYEVWFNEWRMGQTKNCFICGLSMFFRKRILPYSGLFDTSFKHIDFEFTVRITSKKINIVFCNAIMVCAVINSSSVSQSAAKYLEKELRRVSLYYDYLYPIGEILQTPGSCLKMNFSKIWPQLFARKKNYPDYNFVLAKDLKTTDIDILNSDILKIINGYNLTHGIEFFEKVNDSSYEF